MRTVSYADLLDLLDDAAYVVYSANSRNVLVNYLHTSPITIAVVDERLEAKLLTMRAKRIGTLHLITASLLAKYLRHELAKNRKIP